MAGSLENHPEQQISKTIILFKNDTLRPQAEKVARYLQIPEIFPAKLTSAWPEESSFLTVTDKGLEFSTGGDQGGPLFIDFGSATLQFRLKQGSRKKEAIARAVGLKNNRTPIIFDLTAGMGRDAFILASLGCIIHLFERNKIIYTLLADGLARAKKDAPDGPASLMTLHQGDALEEMSQVAQNIPPQIIYLDPMFPHRRKSALVKKELRLIRELVGDDPDAKLLFTAARKLALERVVCKRPKQAAPLGTVPADMSIKSKKHRFDVYFSAR